MPVLSAAVNAPYAPDDAFVPIKTFPNKADIPDYSVRFIAPPDYLATDFAFDSYENVSDLVSPDVVDKHFFTSRYERLFLRKGSRSAYHCASWMAVPCTKPTPTTYAFTKHKFVLDVGGVNIGLGLPAASVHRNLKLSAPANIQATWVSKRSATTQKEILDVPDITLFNSKVTDRKIDSVDIEISNGQYGDAGAYVQITDTVDNKVIGKVRIIFLEMLTLRVFPIRITDEGTRFRFDRLGATAMPHSLESLGSVNGFLHGNVADDVKTYGFNQIGINVDFDSTGTKLINTNGQPMEDPSAPATLVKIDKSQIKMSDGAALPNPVVTDAAYSAILQAFLDKVDHLRYQTSTLTEKRSKFSTILVFVTEFRILPTTTGLSRSGVAVNEHIGESRPQHSLDPVSLVPPNATLFETIRTSILASQPWIDQQKTPVPPVLNHFHKFGTLVHEGSHALFVNHLFTEAQNFPELDMCAAHKWLRLYILRKRVGSARVDDVAMLFEYDELKVRIDDLATGVTVQGGSETLFDLIINLGMEKGIDKFINDKIFYDGPRPSGWNGSAAIDLPLGDLIFWISLNDIVKFSEQNSISNIMDYDASAVGFNTAGVAYIEQVPVRFNRFQWELVRKTAKRMKEKEIIP